MKKFCQWLAENRFEKHDRFITYRGIGDMESSDDRVKPEESLWSKFANLALRGKRRKPSPLLGSIFGKEQPNNDTVYKYYKDLREPKSPVKSFPKKPKEIKPSAYEKFTNWLMRLGHSKPSNAPGSIFPTTPTD